MAAKVFLWGGARSYKYVRNTRSSVWNNIMKKLIEAAVFRTNTKCGTVSIPKDSYLLVLKYVFYLNVFKIWTVISRESLAKENLIW